ncbi:MAG: hypothetical protein R3B48_14330 [Kofleriaceae bacterium]
MEPTAHVEPLDPDATEVRPSYGAAELAQAIAEDRRAVAALDAELAGLHAQRGKTVEAALRQADLGVRRRHLLALEACQADGRWCPPQLRMSWTIREDADVPVSLDAELRFDRESWRTLSKELWARGCDCRSMQCVDAMTQTIDVLEARPTPEVQGDHDASSALTAARGCLWRLRGLARGRGPTAGRPDAGEP